MLKEFWRWKKKKKKHEKKETFENKFVMKNIIQNGTKRSRFENNNGGRSEEKIKLVYLRKIKRK